MKTYRIRQDDRRSFPKLFKFGKDRLDVEFVLTESCKYSFEDGHAGWNKLVGIKYFTWKDNEVFIAWRYNPGTGLFQIIPSARLEGDLVFPIGGYINVAPDVVTDASLFEERGKVFLVSGEEVTYIPIANLNKGKLPAMVSQPAFGSKYPAPHYMEIGLNIK